MLRRVKDLTHDLGKIPQGTFVPPPVPTAVSSAAADCRAASPAPRRLALDLPGFLIWLLVVVALGVQTAGLVWLARYA